MERKILVKPRLYKKPVIEDEIKYSLYVLTSVFRRSSIIKKLTQLLYGQAAKIVVKVVKTNYVELLHSGSALVKLTALHAIYYLRR